jgi:putative ABC transport system permease protein
MRSVLQDFRFALRLLVKQPGFTAIAVITLALGIGANTAIFSVVNAVLLRPLPYPHADRIMFLSEADKSSPALTPISLSLPDYLDWRRDNTVFENLAASHHDSLTLSDIPGRAPEQISASAVTANFFKVIGLKPRLGRTFSEEEDKPGSPFVILISDRFWTRIFQRDPAVIGRAMTLQNRRATIIGVMPPEMRSPSDTDVWFSLMRRNNNGVWQNRIIHPWIFGWGRLKADVSASQARSEMKAIAARLEQQYPASNTNATALVTPLLESIVGKYRLNLTFLLGAVALVLLIACANLANLFAARGAARGREFAIRAAVGASRAQLIRQLLLESLLIAAVGGVLGFLIALWSRDLLQLLAPHDVARFREVSFDWRVLFFTLLLAGLTSVLFGSWPAWQASKIDIQPNLQAGAHGSSDTVAARRTRDWLVIGDVALTLVLLSSAGLVLKSFARLQALKLGFEPRGFLTARIDLPYSAYSDYKKVLNFSKSLIDKVKELPGVETVALGSNPPLLTGWQIGFVREGVPPPPVGQEPEADSEVIEGDYFATFKTSLLRGRTFNERDTKASPLVAIIDQTLAEKYFPGEDPIGKRLSTDPDDTGVNNRSFQIVGVAARMKFHGSDESATMPVIYFPLSQVERHSLVLLVRAPFGTASFEKTVQRIVSSIDPRQPVYDARTMSSRVAETWATQRLLTFLLSVFAGLALLLATIGLYGVLSYSAVRRVREIALRLAFGARPAQIRGLIFSHGFKLLLIGCGVGAVGAIAASALLESVLFEITPAQPVIYLTVAGVLIVVTMIACWYPAERASRVDPITALRSE